METILTIISSGSEEETNKMFGLNNLNSGGISLGTNAEGDSDRDSAKFNAIWTAKAVFQALAPLSKQYVMRMLFVEIPIPLAMWLDATVADSAKAHQHAITELTSLRIITESQNQAAGGPSYLLNPYFKRSLQQAVICPTEPWHVPAPVLSADSSSAAGATTSSKPAKPHTLPIELIDEFFGLRWDNLLRLLVGAPITTLTPTHANTFATSNKTNSLTHIHIDEIGEPLKYMRTYLKAARLATEEVDLSGYQILKITAKGYEFMLRDTLSQVWGYLHTVLMQQQDKSDMLALLFMLSYCTLGQGYLLSALTKQQQQQLFVMSHCGLVLIPTLSSKRFYPGRAIIDVLFRKSMVLTPAGSVGAAGGPRGGYAQDIHQLWGQSSVHSAYKKADGEGILASSSAGSSSSIGSSSYVSTQPRMTIIVETNNQVVAYVHTDVHFAMLQLFVDVILRTPNMVMGRITRDKAKAAYKIGLSSQQIIDFLRAHAHPVVMRNVAAAAASGLESAAASTSIVPENVCDLLRVWENESHRLAMADAVLFKLADVRGCTLRHYHDIVAQMQRVGVLLWCLEAKRLVAVTPVGAPQLQSYAQEVLGLHHVS